MPQVALNEQFMVSSLPTKQETASAPTLWIPSFELAPSQLPAPPKSASPTRQKSHTVSHSSDERPRFLSVDSGIHGDHGHSKLNGHAAPDANGATGFLSVGSTPLAPARPKTPVEKLRSAATGRERFLSVSNVPPSDPTSPNTEFGPAIDRPRFLSVAAVSQAQLPDSISHPTDSILDTPITPADGLRSLSISPGGPRPSSEAGHIRNHHRSSTDGTNGVFQHDHAEEQKKSNRILMVLMRRLGSSKTFGENMIFMLNRLGQFRCVFTGTDEQKIPQKTSASSSLSSKFSIYSSPRQALRSTSSRMTSESCSMYSFES